MLACRCARHRGHFHGQFNLKCRLDASSESCQSCPAPSRLPQHKLVNRPFIPQPGDRLTTWSQPCLMSCFARTHRTVLRTGANKITVYNRIPLGACAPPDLLCENAGAQFASPHDSHHIVCSSSAHTGIMARPHLRVSIMCGSLSNRKASLFCSTSIERERVCR